MGISQCDLEVMMSTLSQPISISISISAAPSEICRAMENKVSMMLSKDENDNGKALEAILKLPDS